MKKLLIAALILLGLLVAAVLIVPSVIDWNAYKAQIADKVSAATGRKVELKGDIGLSLLPAPALTVRDARLANAPGGSEEDMARLKELDVRVALGPLLGGHIQVQSIRLIDPTFLFETLPDGRFNWDLSGAGTGRTAGAGPGGSGDGLASAVSFDQVTVQNGTIHYRDARTGQSEVIDQIDARIVAGSFTGPFQGQGGFRARGVPLRGEMFVSRLIDGAAVQVRATLSMADTDATLRFAGIVTNPPGSGGSRAQGDLRVEGSDLSRALALVRKGSAAGEDRKATALLAQSFGIRTAVEASPTAASFTNLEAQLGDTRATGTATLRSGTPARAELTLALNRLDLDAWLDRAGAGGGSDAGAQPAARNGNTVKSAPPSAPSGGAPAPTGGATQPGGFSLPDALDAKLDLAVDGITYNGGIIRQGRVEASLTGGTLNIDRVSALLPGGSDIVAAGELAAANGQPNLNLRMEANADNLRAVLEWLRVDVRAVPADRLRRASVAAQLQGRPGRLDVNGLDLRVDASRLTGAVAYVDRGRPAFGARLDLDRLNLDAYLPQAGDSAAAQAAPAANGGGNAAAPASANGAAQTSARNGRSSMSPARLLAGVDANLELSVGQLTVRNTPVQGLRLDATAAGGALSIKEATVQDAAGVKLRLDGQIAGLEPLRGAHLTLNAEAASLEGVARAVPWPEGAPAPERLGAVKAQARLSGDAERLAVELGAEAAEGSLEVGGTVLSVEKNPSVDLKLRAKHPELARLASLFADDAVSGSYGPMDLYTELAGTRKAFTLGNIQGVLAGVTVKGKASADLNGSKPRVEADLQTGDLELDRLAVLPAAARPAGATSPAAVTPPGASAAAAGDFSGLRRFDGRFALTSSALVKGGTRIENPALRATVTNGVLTVERFDGTLMGGQLGATGRLAAPGNQTPTAEATITLSKAKLAEAVGGGLGGGALEIAGGVLDAEANLTTSGAGGDAMLKALAGQGRISARDGLLRGFDLGVLRDRLTKLERPQELLGAVMGGLQGGETRFARLDGSFAIDKGVARTEDTRLTSDLGEAVAAGQVNLPAQTIDMRVRLTVQSDQSLPPLTVRMTGALDKPTRSFEMQEVQEYFARRAAEGLLNKVVPKDLPIPGGGNAPKPDALLKGLIDGLRR
ncbi:AsmA family protein [Azospirillum brasilense]|uniref:AsmA family protein n=1 Tax=Azospirillum brasilense TaxID=192 RepID=A0A4D8QKL0_AZOBR|nr:MULTISPECIES: AsmA family protein [Azospirillum]MDW7557429.1 AsmA family protein [Azospirillum brasilense]MDW7596867.1 AsmA family protein [Azospirillum brasilense]MDW7631924.1 AsmA family protein [Azospirillum brasilense]MDX5953533.1 AsmA family protein [Azospirillum brasilense]QCO09921.1 AsmA family protein [Azospirillum brasilense]